MIKTHSHWFVGTFDVMYRFMLCIVNTVAINTCITNNLFIVLFTFPAVLNYVPVLTFDALLTMCHVSVSYIPLINTIRCMVH